MLLQFSNAIFSYKAGENSADVDLNAGTTLTSQARVEAKLHYKLLIPVIQTIHYEPSLLCCKNNGFYVSVLIIIF